ncbi:MAG: hypothetical protein FJ265_08590 [Planctomycetes bacterium]|nr:hypothetical protein [Planctomycetota bacterium]
MLLQERKDVTNRILACLFRVVQNVEATVQLTHGLFGKAGGGAGAVGGVKKKAAAKGKGARGGGKRR